MILNVNGLNLPLKRHRVLNGLKNKAHLHAAYKTHFRNKDRHRLKVKGWKEIVYEMKSYTQTK